jgi:hypothetical protein
MGMGMHGQVTASLEYKLDHVSFFIMAEGFQPDTRQDLPITFGR